MVNDEAVEEDGVNDGDDEDSGGKTPDSDEMDAGTAAANLLAPPAFPSDTKSVVIATGAITIPLSSSSAAARPVSVFPRLPRTMAPVSCSSSAAAFLPSVTLTSPVSAPSDSQAPVVMSCSKHPIAVLHVPVQRQYTMTRKDSKRIKREEKEALVNVSVRIMGTLDGAYLYFVAKSEAAAALPRLTADESTQAAHCCAALCCLCCVRDICQLICLRKGSVAKAIHEFSPLKKARMPVLCQRSSRTQVRRELQVISAALSTEYVQVEAAALLHAIGALGPANCCIRSCIRDRQHQHHYQTTAPPIVPCDASSS
jgi:hypothetical protein